MPNQPPLKVTDTAVELTSGLVAGQSYIAQHVGGARVQYANYATDPTGQDVGWHILKENDFILVPNVDQSNPVWVRTERHTANLTISDA